MSTKDIGCTIQRCATHCQFALRSSPLNPNSVCWKTLTCGLHNAAIGLLSLVFTFIGNVWGPQLPHLDAAQAVADDVAEHGRRRVHGRQWHAAPVAEMDSRQHSRPRPALKPPVELRFLVDTVHPTQPSAHRGLVDLGPALRQLGCSRDECSCDNCFFILYSTKEWQRNVNTLRLSI